MDIAFAKGGGGEFFFLSNKIAVIGLGNTLRKDDGIGIIVLESNANVLTNNAPPYDPAFGTYQLRGLLCRIEKY